MERSFEDIASEALRLSVASRAALAKRLLDSLDELTPDENMQAWLDEAARRYRQLKSGTATTLSSDEVFAKLDARHRQ